MTIYHTNKRVQDTLYSNKYPENESTIKIKAKETDPNGKSPHEPGAKLSAGKPRIGLVVKGFSKALEAVSEVGTLGAVKYSDNGWQQVPKGIDEYTDAMGRHWLKETYEDFDIDLTERANKGIRHATCVAWNALARLELILQEEEKDNYNEEHF